MENKLSCKKWSTLEPVMLTSATIKRGQIVRIASGYLFNTIGMVDYNMDGRWHIYLFRSYHNSFAHFHLHHPDALQLLAESYDEFVENVSTYNRKIVELQNKANNNELSMFYSKKLNELKDDIKTKRIRIAELECIIQEIDNKNAIIFNKNYMDSITARVIKQSEHNAAFKIALTRTIQTSIKWFVMLSTIVLFCLLKYKT